MKQQRHTLSVRFVRDPNATNLVRNRFYTIGEVAQMLRVTERSVWRWLQTGKLAGVTYGEGGKVRIRGTAIFLFLKPYAPKVKPKKPKSSEKRKITRRSPAPQPAKQAPK